MEIGKPCPDLGTEEGLFALSERWINDSQIATGHSAPLAYASFWHFFIKLFFAAPLSGLPSLLTAFGSQDSFLHFFTNAVFAAPASGFPSLPSARASQALCAKPGAANDIETRTAAIVRTYSAPVAVQINLANSTAPADPLP